MPVVISVTGPYRNGEGEVDQSFNVVMEVRDGDNYYLVCEEMNSNHLKVFRQEIDGSWNETQDTELQRMLDYFKDNEKKSNEFN